MTHATLGELRNRLAQSAVWLVLSSLLLGCGEGRDLVSTAKRPTAGEQIYAQAVSAATERPVSSIAAFRARHGKNFYGEAHNRGMTLYFSRLASNPHAGRCQALRWSWGEARRLAGADSLRVGGALEVERHFRLAPHVFSCDNQVRRVSSVGLGAISAANSGDPEPFFDAIVAVAEAEPSTAIFLAQLAAVVDSAELVLSGDALDQVYAVASVAAESHDYWLTDDNLPVVADSLYAAYAPCFERPGDPGECIYPTARVDEGFPGSDSRFTLVSGAVSRDCSVHFRGWRVIKYDIGGAVGGALVGGAPGASAGALTVSVAEATVQALDYLSCVFAF